MTAAIIQLLVEALEDIQLDVWSALSNLGFTSRQAGHWLWNTVGRTLETDKIGNCGKEIVLGKICWLNHPLCLIF